MNLFCINFQVYKISNLNKDGKSIYIAGSGLFSLIENEQAIMCVASSYNPVEIENKFDEYVNAAVQDYSVFLERVYRNRNLLAIELMTNFTDFFNLIIDIKKSEAANELEKNDPIIAAAAAASAIEAVDAAIAAAAAAQEAEDGYAAATKAPAPKKSRK